MLRKDVERARRAWALALYEIAVEVGEGSPLYKAMGSVAWGRYEGEPSASDSKDNAMFGYAYLRGLRDALMRVAEAEHWAGANALRVIHDRVREIMSKGSTS